LCLFFALIQTYPRYSLDIYIFLCGGWGVHRGDFPLGAWPIVGLLLLSVVSGLACAGAMILLGVQGVMVALTKRLEILQISVENLDTRFTREVKTRAGLKGVEAVKEAKSLAEEARIHLVAKSPPTAPARPSVLNIGRR